MTPYGSKSTRRLRSLALTLGLAASLPAVADETPSAPPDRDYSFSEVITESLLGDVYSEPSKWQELSLGDFFSKGWDKPWASPPPGAGGAP